MPTALAASASSVTPYHLELLKIDGRTKRFPCPFPGCDDITTTLDLAFGHINTEHLDLAPYACSRCKDVSFAAPSELEMHWKEAHDEVIRVNPKTGKTMLEDGTIQVR